MCGRYYFKLDDSSIAKSIKRQLEIIPLDFKSGEVYPGDNVLVFIPKSDNKISLTTKRWGIKRKSLLINARLESLDILDSYKDIKDNRCIIIANYFYEWQDKNKFEVKTNDNFIYLGALYNKDNECVIITKDSYGKLKDIHKRIPLIFDKDEMLRYLANGFNKPLDKDLLISPTEMNSLL